MPPPWRLCVCGGITLIVKPIAHGLELARNDPDYIRSEGLHASAIYGPLFEKLQPARYDKRDKDGKKTGLPLVRIEMGFRFEKIIEREFARQLLGDRPPEMRAPHHKECPDRRKRMAAGKVCWCGAGIYFSPDYLFNETGELILGEFKATWMSTTGALSDNKFDKYKTQLMLYCYWLKITKARIFIYFVNGGWQKTGFEPELRAWEIEFTQRELEVTYNKVMRFARKEGMV